MIKPLLNMSKIFKMHENKILKTCSKSIAYFYINSLRSFEGKAWKVIS